MSTLPSPALLPPVALPAVLQFYPTYLGMWQAVQSAVQRADLLKYFIMHAIGGAPLTAGRVSAGHPATPPLARSMAQNALPVA